MIAFPNCKINLGLNIVGKREDGYHDLETVFYPLPICDAIEVIGEIRNIARATTPESNIQFTSSGLTLNNKTEDNLCVKAYYVLKNNYPQIQPVKMHLHKSIPIGAGLAGGSADGAFSLNLFNQKFELGLSTEQLLDYALQLGSDCPFFIINKPSFATGRGEFLEPIGLDLSPYKLVLINPGIQINTAEAFSSIKPILPSKSIKKIVQQSVATWKNELKNDFEEPVFKKYPEIKSIKDELYKTGAVYASMTGSGSTLYGIFEKDKSVQFHFPSHYFVRSIEV